MRKHQEDDSLTSRLTERLFENLTGTWILHRSLQSANASEPSGRCTGKATFTRTQPSPVVDTDGKLQLADAELLYHEQGDFEMTTSAPGQASNVLKFPFSRKYIWRLQKTEDADKLSVWFTKPGTNTIDYLFHKIDIALPDEDLQAQKGEIALHGAGGHLCVEDFYSSSYTFNMSSGSPDLARLVSWTTTHEVRGPKKDQILETTFTKT